MLNKLLVVSIFSFLRSSSFCTDLTLSVYMYIYVSLRLSPPFSVCLSVCLSHTHSLFLFIGFSSLSCFLTIALISFFLTFPFDICPIWDSTWVPSWNRCRHNCPFYQSKIMYMTKNGVHFWRNNKYLPHPGFPFASAHIYVFLSVYLTAVVF
jgi:hypothetical protein